MTKLTWDEVGERRFETGVDQGVLYTLEGDCIPWNGLVQITEKSSRAVTPYFQDGRKFLDAQVVGPYAATLQAFTYPDELDFLVGLAELESGEGIRLHDQKARPFHLSYRTKVGNDSQGLDHGYKIHIVYNVLAIPSDATSQTVGENPVPGLFEWSLTAMPSTVEDHLPTAHISFDSRRISPGALVVVERQIYGDAENAPSLPSLTALLAEAVGEP